MDLSHWLQFAGLLLIVAGLVVWLVWNNLHG
jgi:hypothetical protein